MVFQIDWISFSIGFVVLLVIYNAAKLISSYLKLKLTRQKIAELDKKLKKIDLQIAANKDEIEKSLIKHKSN